ncbi:MAG: hypothetical protein J2P37_34055, partial [Ktedonobacteraceae bacterium]|nr:hypothetical protein [Ktedonobacteraceae bacterium]
MSTRTPFGVLHRTPRRLGSVQQRFLQFQAVRDHLLCLRTKDAERPAYVNVLEVNGLSYDLKSEEEQRQLNTLNQHFLASLDFDLQVLWCVLPLHAEPYLASFVWPAEHPIPAEEDDTDDRAAVRSSLVNRDACAELAAAHVSAMEAFGQTGKTLLTRKIYLISRVEPEMAPPRRFFLTLRKRSSQTSSIHEALERARQLLDARAEHLERLLSSMGLSARRLSGHELIRFAATCLQPYQAMQASLPTEILEGLERPVVLREEGATKTTQQAPFSLAANTMGSTTPPSARRWKRRKSVAAVESAPADLGNLTDLLAPEAITLSPDHLCIDDEWVRVLAVHRLPRVVSTGWLRPLATLDEPLMVSYHLHPLPTSDVLPRLQRRYTDHLASQLAARRKGNEVDPHVRLAASDLEPLIEQLASGEERMLQVSMHVLIRGRNRHELDTRTERVREVLRGMLVQSRVPRFEHDLALLS